VAEPTKPTVPDGAPDDVKKFFDCSGDKMVWKKGKVTWLDLPIDPDVSFEHGKAKDTIDITITFDLGKKISFTLNASVNASGELVVDTSNVPDLSALSEKLPGKKTLDDAIANINAWFRKNGKKLKGATFKKGEVTLEKTTTTGAYVPPIVQPSDDEPNQPVPVSSPDPQPVSLTPAPLLTPTTEQWDTAVAAAPIELKSSRSSNSLYRMLTMAALIAVITAGLVIGFVFGGGGVPASSGAPTLIAGSGPTASPSSAPTQAPALSSIAVSSAPTLAPTAAASASSSPTAVPASVSPAPSVAEVATLDRACIQVTHQKLGSFVSYLDFAMYWTGLDVDHFEATIQGTNDNKPLVVNYDPASGAYRGLFGLHQPGNVTITNVTAVLTGGSTLDVTQDLTDFLAGPTLLVRYPQQDSFGTCD
jgi:hypothetical protein